MYRAAAPHLETIIDGMEDALNGADCLISSYLFPINKAIAEKHNVPLPGRSVKLGARARF